jgi:hypothetical protein
MKQISYVALVLFALNAYSQEHFSGIATSKRVGILNGKYSSLTLVLICLIIKLGIKI